MRRNIPLEEAQELLLAMASPAKECKIPLFEAVGRVLSREVRAPINLPPFDKSPLDGYAVQARDTEQASEDHPAILEVVEEVAAGYAAKKKVTAGTAVKVMTGTPIPQGADVVVKFEDVKRTGKICRLFSPLRPGSNIILAGEDVKKGEKVACPGALISPALVGLIATFSSTVSHGSSLGS